MFLNNKKKQIYVSYNFNTLLEELSLLNGKSKIEITEELYWKLKKDRLKWL